MFDTKCYQLASDFLEDYPDVNNAKNRGELAQVIQDAIEDTIAGFRSEARAGQLEARYEALLRDQQNALRFVEGLTKEVAAGRARELALRQELEGLAADWAACKDNHRSSTEDRDSWAEGCASGYGQAVIELQSILGKALSAVPRRRSDEARAHQKVLELQG